MINALIDGTIAVADTGLERRSAPLFTAGVIGWWSMLLLAACFCSPRTVWETLCDR